MLMLIVHYAFFILYTIQTVCIHTCINALRDRKRVGKNKEREREKDREGK